MTKLVLVDDLWINPDHIVAIKEYKSANGRIDIVTVQNTWHLYNHSMVDVMKALAHAIEFQKIEAEDDRDISS